MAVKTSHILIKLTEMMPWLPMSFVRFQRWLYDLSGGRMMTTIEGCPICVVTIKGAKSGKIRKYPLMYVPYKEGLLLVASRGGAPINPVWYFNLKANPEIEVHHRGVKKKLTARHASAEEKVEVWPTCVEHYPSYEDYQGWSTRDIPVFICLP